MTYKKGEGLQTANLKKVISLIINSCCKKMYNLEQALIGYFYLYSITFTYLIAKKDGFQYTSADDCYWTKMD